MKILKLFLSLLVIHITINLPAQSVTLDPAFGENGITTFSHTVGLVDFDNLGNIVVAGSSADGFLSITKTNAEGKIDTGFGTEGVTTVSEYKIEYLLGMKITKENKIFIIGWFLSPARTTIMLQFNEDGSLDDTYGEHGKIIADAVRIDTRAFYKMNFESDDFILTIHEGGGCPGFNLFCKHNYLGEIDESFGNNGVVNLINTLQPFYQATGNARMGSFKILRDQNILITGQMHLASLYGEYLFFCKLTPQGDLVTDFANNGVMVIQPDFYIKPGFDGRYTYFIDAIEDSNGNLVLTGLASISQIGDLSPFISRFNSTGKIDSGFGQDGFLQLPSLPSTNNKVIQNGSNYLVKADQRIFSINQDGTLDMNFNGSGDFFYGYTIRDMKLQSAGKLLIMTTDSILARLNIPSTISNKEDIVYPSDLPVIFPNPVKDYLHFKTEKQFEISDIQGKILLKSKEAVQSVDVSHLNAGIYFIRFENDKAIKFIKE